MVCDQHVHHLCTCSIKFLEFYLIEGANCEGEGYVGTINIHDVLNFLVSISYGM